MNITSLRPLLLLFLLVAVPEIASAQDVILRIICDLPNSDSESSGVYIQSRDSIWSVNDNANPSEIHLIDTFGNKFREIDIVGASNLDWEELAHDDAGNLYIGDFGNNTNDRQDLRVLRIVNPQEAQSPTALAEIINFSYEDQTEFPPLLNQWYYNCEAMLLMGDTVFVFTKDYSFPYIGFTRIYWFLNTPGEHVAAFFGSFYTFPGSIPKGSITGAAISPDRSKVILVSNRKLWLFRNFEGQNFLNGEVHEFDFPEDTQKEAVAFADECTVYITDERDAGNNTGGFVYEWDLCAWLQTNTTQVAEQKANIAVFPQPSFGDVTLRYDLPAAYPTAVLWLYDPLGRLICQRELDTHAGDINFTSLILNAKGIYHYRITASAQQIAAGNLQVL